MVTGLLCIFGTYAIGIVLVHLLHNHYQEYPDKPIHYVILTRDNQMQVEWYLRSLLFFSWIKGRNVMITILDHDSSDDTVQIVERLSVSDFTGLQMVKLTSDDTLEVFLSSHMEEDCIIFNLINDESLKPIPLF